MTDQADGFTKLVCDEGCDEEDDLNILDVIGIKPEEFKISRVGWTNNKDITFITVYHKPTGFWKEHAWKPTEKWTRRECSLYLLGRVVNQIIDYKASQGVAIE